MPDFSKFDHNFPYESYYAEHIKQAEVSGEWLSGLCPFHEDRKKSFTVSLTTGQWKCFASCGSGNVISFHARQCNLTNSEAFQDLCIKYGFEDLVKNHKNMTATGVENKIIPADVLRQMPDLPETWIKALEEKRGWRPEVIKALGLKAQTVYQSKKTGKIKPVRGTPTRIAIPVKDSHYQTVNIKLYCPHPKPGEPKNIPWGSGYKTKIFWPHQKHSPCADKSPVYICEGEPDAICALSFGLNACTPLSKTKTWSRGSLKRFSGLDVVVVPDADKPGMKYAEQLALQIQKVAKSVQIIQWPEFMGFDPVNQEWPDNHGQDLTDFFMKHKKTLADFQNLPLTPPPDPKKQTIKSDDSFVSPVTRKNCCYYKTKYTTQGEIEEKVLSNFIFQITRIYNTPKTGIVRAVEIENDLGQKAGPAELPPASMASKREFAKWCYSLGNFVWRGTTADMEDVFALEMRESDPRIVDRIDHVGWVQKEGMWLFPHFGIKDGKIIPADDEGIVWVGGKGLQVLSPVDEGSDEDINRIAMPQPRYDLSDERVDEVRSQFIKLIRQNINNFNIYLGLGFVAMCAYYPEISQKFEAPIIFLAGQHQVGKNTVARLIYQHFGLQSGTSLSNATHSGITNMFGYYSSIPVWLDEYRAHEKTSQQHDGLLRSVYDRTSGIRGTPGFGFKCRVVRAPLMLSGEAYTEDAAFASRCAQIYLSPRDRNDSVYPKIEDLVPYLSGIFIKIIKEKTEAKVKQLFENIQALIRELKEKQGMPTREATVYAVLSECFYTIYNPDDVNNDQDHFGRWLYKQARDQVQVKTEESPVYEWLEDIVALKAKGEINGNHIEYDYESDQVWLWVGPIFRAWQADCRRRGVNPWPKATILHLLEEQPFFISKNELRYINTQRKRVVVLDGEGLPEEIVSGLSGRQNNERDEYY